MMNYQRQNLKRKNKQLLVYNFISIYTKQLVLGLTAFKKTPFRCNDVFWVLFYRSYQGSFNRGKFVVK